MQSVGCVEKKKQQVVGDLMASVVHPSRVDAGEIREFPPEVVDERSKRRDRCTNGLTVGRMVLSTVAGLFVEQVSYRSVYEAQLCACVCTKTMRVGKIVLSDARLAVTGNRRNAPCMWR